MLTLIATPGAANANTYATMVDAASYHAAHVALAVWEGFTLELRAQALAQATAVLDRVVTWQGTRTSTAQALAWPRANVWNPQTEALFSSSTIPTFLQQATAEMARHLAIADRTSPHEYEGMRRVRYGTMEVELDGSGSITLLPAAVQQMIAPYVQRITGGIATKVLRV